MTDGRIINELKIDQTIEEKLKTMPAYVSRWHLNLKASRKTASTRRDFVAKIHNFLSFINEDVMKVALSDIDEDNVSRYFLSIQTKKDSSGNLVYTSDSYQGTVWSCLNNFFEYFVKRGEINRNYIQQIDRPKNRDLDRINENRTMLTKKDFRKILDAVDSEKNAVRRARDKAILTVLMNTGMRKTALTCIMLNDIDLDNRSLVIVDKGNKRHEYVLNDITCETISDWLDNRDSFTKGKDDNHLFLSDHGNEIASRTMAEIVEKYCIQALGKPLSPHKLRSGYCSILYNATGDIEFVRRSVGHSQVSTTSRYIVTKGSEKERASEIMNSIF